MRRLDFREGRAQKNGDGRFAPAVPTSSESPRLMNNAHIPPCPAPRNRLAR